MTIGGVHAPSIGHCDQRQQLSLVTPATQLQCAEPFGHLRVVQPHQFLDDIGEHD